MGDKQQLLLEALLLRMRYSKEDCTDVAELLRAEGEEPLATILTLVSRLENLGTKKVSSRKTSKQVKNAMAKLKDTNPELYSSLATFQSQLLSREILPEPSDLRRFASTLDLGELPTRRREQTVQVILKELARLPADELRKHLQSISRPGEARRSDLHIVADAIHKRNPSDEGKR